MQSDTSMYTDAVDSHDRDPRDVALENMQRQLNTMAEALARSAKPDRPENSAFRLPRPILPDPALFAGDPSSFYGWKLDMQAKLSTDAAALGDRRAKFSYVYSRLDKTARKVAATYFQLGHDLKTADEFLTYLNGAYSNRKYGISLELRVAIGLVQVREKLVRGLRVVT
ncbi:hypothetical protein SEPCBS57363_005935 [Sporothrix epigloea]|uniref:Uncharacterized protein n=1 Tax=Sporothrix epigloea TaxID=1892477 RepID=A0ABP0E0A4_9PEZI